MRIPPSRSVSEFLEFKRLDSRTGARPATVTLFTHIALDAIRLAAFLVAPFGRPVTATGRRADEHRPARLDVMLRLGIDGLAVDDQLAACARFAARNACSRGFRLRALREERDRHRSRRTAFEQDFLT